MQARLKGERSRRAGERRGAPARLSPVASTPNAPNVFEATLAANLAALDAVAPQLAERLRWPVERNHILASTDGTFQYKKGLTTLPLSGPSGDPFFPMPPPPGRAIFLFGLGAGEGLAHALSLKAREIIAWERDPSMLRLALSRVALVSALRSG